MKKSVKVVEKTKDDRLPCALVIGGLDNTCGAGIYADNRIFAQFHFWPVNIVTVLTAQNSVDGVMEVFPVPDDLLTKQFESIFNEFKIQTVKIGMLANASQVKLVASLLKKYLLPNVPVVVDPVLFCKNNFTHKDNTEIINAYNTDLFNLATFITPNLSELDLLATTIRNNITKKAKPSNNNFMNASAWKNCLDVLQESCLILNNYTKVPNIFCKFTKLLVSEQNEIPAGGVLFINNEFFIFEYEQQKKVYHGSGCNLASVLAAYLPSTVNKIEAIKKTWIYVQNLVVTAKKVYQQLDTFTPGYS